MRKWTILAVALACGTFLLPSEASAGRYRHRHRHQRMTRCAVQPMAASVGTTAVARPQVAQVPPAPTDSYQSFSYEPGPVATTPTYAATYSASPVHQTNQPHYLSGSYKALGNYSR